MSAFGLIVMLLFVVAMGGLAALIYSGNTDLFVSKLLMLVLNIIVSVEFVLALYEYPCYLVDGIVFICMGEPMLAWVMFGIVGLIVVFTLAMILPRVKWYKSLAASPTKLIVLGLLLMMLLAYNELLGGVYSFDSYEQYKEVRARYEEYDDRFFPTKFIRHMDGDVEKIALYPFDVTTAAGPLDMLYKGETFMVTNEDGTTELFYYPFTYKLYEGSEPVSFEATAEPVPIPSADPAQPVSGTDVSGSDVSGSDISGGDAPTTPTTGS